MRDPPIGGGFARGPWLAVAMVLLAPGIGSAQGPTQDLPGPDEGLDVVDVPLAADPDLSPGLAAVTEGMVGADGLRFRIGDLSVMQPVVVGVLAAEPGQDLRLSLFGSGWDDAHLSGSTGADEIVTFTTRTEGVLNLLVEGPEDPVPFALVAWVGDEAEPRMGDVLVRRDAYRTTPGALLDRMPSDEAMSGTHRAGGVPTSILLLGAFLGGGALVLATLFLMRRSKNDAY